MADMYGTGKKGKATKLASKVVRTLGRCEKCGSPNYESLQSAHIIGRKYNATRTMLRNQICLCASCHAHFTDHPLEFANWVMISNLEQYTGTMSNLAKVPFKAKDAYWDMRIDFLNDMLNQIDSGDFTLIEARDYED